MAGPSKTVIAPAVADIRRRAAAQGRDPASILIFTLLTIVTGRTDEEARAKFADYRSYVSPEGALTLMSGWTGIDFSAFSPDDPVTHIRNDAIHSAVDALTVDDPSRIWTVRELAEESAIGGLGGRVVGAPGRVVDEMEAWLAETGIDGFNLAYAITPGSFEDIVEFIVPELQRRGLYKQAYATGTLRQKLFGSGARLAAPHPGAAYRSPARALAAA